MYCTSLYKPLWMFGQIKITLYCCMFSPQMALPSNINKY